MPVVLARREAATDDVAPERTYKRFAKKLEADRVSVAHDAVPIDHDYAARQQVEHVLQPVGKPLLFLQLLPAQRSRLGQAFL
ncbi:hypothetical protein PsSCT_37850 [Pseudomonas sp. SCT]